MSHTVTITSPSPVLFIIHSIIRRYKGCHFYRVPELYRIESLHPPGRLRAQWHDKRHALYNNLFKASLNEPYKREIDQLSNLIMRANNGGT